MPAACIPLSRSGSRTRISSSGQKKYWKTGSTPIRKIRHTALPSIYCQTLPNGSRVCMHYPCTLALTFAEAFISSCKLMSMRRSTPEYRDCRFRQEICCVKTISVIPGSCVPVIQSNCSSTIRKHASVLKGFFPTSFPRLHCGKKPEATS